MKKKKLPRLSLNRETIRHLDGSALRKVPGGTTCVGIHSGQGTDTAANCLVVNPRRITHDQHDVRFV